MFIFNRKTKFKNVKMDNTSTKIGNNTPLLNVKLDDGSPADTAAILA